MVVDEDGEVPGRGDPAQLEAVLVREVVVDVPRDPAALDLLGPQPGQGVEDQAVDVWLHVEQAVEVIERDRVVRVGRPAVAEAADGRRVAEAGQDLVAAEAQGAGVLLGADPQDVPPAFQELHVGVPEQAVAGPGLQHHEAEVERDVRLAGARGAPDEVQAGLPDEPRHGELRGHGRHVGAVEVDRRRQRVPGWLLVRLLALLDRVADVHELTEAEPGLEVVEEVLPAPPRPPDVAAWGRTDRATAAACFRPASSRSATTRRARL